MTVVSIVLAFMALAAFAGALEARSTNAEEAARAAEVCAPDSDEERCVPEPVAPHVVRGLLLSGGIVVVQLGARAARRRRDQRRGP